MPSVIAPLRGAPFTDEEYVPLPRVMQWIESITNATRAGDVQVKSVDYTLLTTDAGVTCTSETSQSIVMPDATLLKGQEYYVQNASAAGTVTITCFGTQQISGSDAIIISASIPYSAPYMKSDGINWVLLGFLPDSTQIIADVWVDETDGHIVTDTGEDILFYG